MRVIILLSLLIPALAARCQKTVRLEDLFDRYLPESNAQKINQLARQQSIDRFELYRAGMRPQLGFNLQAPAYSKTSTQIVQPNGSIVFQSISQNNALVGLTLQQNIGLTGGTVFAMSELQRFDDFSFDTRSYNGIPVRIGFIQPVFGFNPYRWERLLQPLALQLGESAYNFERENIKGRIIQLYFDILIARENKSIALSNRANQMMLDTIAAARLEMGKISLEEKLQIETGLENAGILYESAAYEERAAIRALNAFLKTDQLDTSFIYLLPQQVMAQDIDASMLEIHMKLHAPVLLQNQYALEEARMNAAKTRVDYGFQANMTGSFGWARGSRELAEIYRSPFVEERLSLTLSVPIVDWGRARHANAIARSQVEIAGLNAAQGEAGLVTTLHNQVDFLNNIRQRITALETIRAKSESRYQISSERYVMGRISLTDLNLAREEKDRLRMDYLLALRDYFISIYEVRKLTGIDPLTNTKI